MALHAVTRHLDRDIDLLDVAGADGVLFERSGEGLAGHGVAATVTTDGTFAAVQQALDGIETDDEVDHPGSGPVAFSAMPFRRGDAADFVIPARIVGRRNDGTRWETLITGDGVVAAVDDGGATPRPARFDIAAAMPADEWCGLVERATKTIVGGAFDKVVLAREVVIAADTPIPRRPLLERLRRTFPGCYVTSVGPMVGASPELLVSRSGDTVRAHPMAGTAPRGGDPSADAQLAASLLSSAKDRSEHQITIDMVWEALLPFCSYVDSEPEPSVVGVANVQHLASLVEGKLSSPPASVLELVGALHPTPAVAGWPVEPALAFIEEHEGFARNRYAGPVGWVDQRGNGSFAVGIRCAELTGTQARVVAGVGVVADSDPALELAETEAKFQAVLGAIARP